MRRLAEAAGAVRALVRAHLLVDVGAVRPHVSRRAEAAVAVRALVVAPLLVHDAHVAVAAARLREGVEAVRAGVAALGRLWLFPHAWLALQLSCRLAAIQKRPLRWP